MPGVIVVRPDTPLFYANAQAVRDDVEADVTSSNGSVKTVVFDLDANDEIDITSAEQLEKLAETLRKEGVVFVLAHLHQPAEEMARATGLLDKVGQDHIFPTVGAAVRWAGSRDVGMTSSAIGPPEILGPEAGPSSRREES